MNMKKSILLLLFLTVQTVVCAQEYFPEGTKWTEIRLDTLKYDSWYSKVDDKWVPNFEIIEYSVKGDYIDKHDNEEEKYKCVYTNGPEWEDSLTLVMREVDHRILVSVLADSRLLWPGEAYQFDWSVGKRLYFEDILSSNHTGMHRYRCHYGLINEIKEGNFGGVRLLKYVDLDGKAPEDEPNSNVKNVDTNGGRIIQGIGITEWDDGECLFGPVAPYSALAMFKNSQWQLYPERHYRSMLVHFERNGEVLYDVWPQKGATVDVDGISKPKVPASNAFYDLQGHRLSGSMLKGIYIHDGKKRVAR